MQNKYLIKASRKFWFWFWTQLMNGFAPSDLHGNYKRPKGIKINIIILFIYNMEGKRGNRTERKKRRNSVRKSEKRIDSIPTDEEDDSIASRTKRRRNHQPNDDDDDNNSYEY